MTVGASLSHSVQARSWPVAQLLAGLGAQDAPDVAVSSIATDSRSVLPGGLFIACQGEYRHGLEFVDQAVAAGATAVVWDSQDAPELEVPSVRLAGLRMRVGEIAARFNDYPARKLGVVGITGTDGKTSCAHILAQAHALLGRKCGYMGTLGYGFLPSLAVATHTTPEAVTLQAWLAELHAAGAQAVTLEVSSHALDQGRVAGLDFSVAVLTNIGRDHLDYHADIDAYVAAKRRLFESANLHSAILNADDVHGDRWLHEFAGQLQTVAYGINLSSLPSRSRYVIARDVIARANGLMLEIDSSWGAVRLESTLLGRFNAYNLLASLAALLECGFELPAAASALGKVTTVPGRMQLVNGQTGQSGQLGRPLVVVDYAHTPGALEQALRAVAEHVRGRVFCVFGCGGDRDAGKRPLMARAAAANADALWITDDNPRNESPQAIVADILAGLPAHTPATVEHDRAAAIAAAIGNAGEGDAVLIAGKGHETCQIIGRERRDFDDYVAARRVLEAA